MVETGRGHVESRIVETEVVAARVAGRGLSFSSPFNCKVFVDERMRFSPRTAVILISNASLSKLSQ